MATVSFILAAGYPFPLFFPSILMALLNVNKDGSQSDFYEQTVGKLSSSFLDPSSFYILLCGNLKQPLSAEPGAVDTHGHKGFEGNNQHLGLQPKQLLLQDSYCIRLKNHHLKPLCQID